MNDNALPKEASHFLRRLRWALSALPSQDKDEIVTEIRSHLEDKLSSGREVSESLAAFGLPETLARSYILEHERSVAIATNRLTHVVPALLRRAATSLTAFVATVSLALAWLPAILFSLVAMMKIFDPAHIGLWRSDTEFYLGFNDRPDLATDVLGLGIYPLTLLIIAIAVVVTRWLGLLALRRQP